MARILIIEDNPANMNLNSLLLSNGGHTVLCAIDGETGLTLARAEQPDLILMDIKRPGMDSLAVTALLNVDLDGDERRSEKKPGSRCRCVYRQTFALQGIADSDR
jgi:CheY-like chemotaxis protein